MSDKGQPMKEWRMIGQILVENGILTTHIAERVLAKAKEHNKRFGFTLEKLGLVTGEELASALAKQYDFKLVREIDKYSYPKDLLGLVHGDLALQNLVFPLKREGSRLLLAIADPTDMKFINNLASNLGMQIMPCVATRNDIYAAISKHYFGRNVTEPSKPTILVVDDDLVTQGIVSELLTREQFHVLTAADGMEGFKEIIASKPHVVLTDKVMPKLDGFALMKSINALPELRSVPVILMSDKLTQTEEISVFEMGFFDYISKPINRIILISRIKRAYKFSQQKYELM